MPIFWRLLTYLDLTFDFCSLKVTYGFLLPCENFGYFTLFVSQ